MQNDCAKVLRKGTSKVKAMVGHYEEYYSVDSVGLADTRTTSGNKISRLGTRLLENIRAPRNLCGEAYCSRQEYQCSRCLRHSRGDLREYQEHRKELPARMSKDVTL